MKTSTVTVSRATLTVQCALFAALIAAGAFIRIPVPVVPFTLQFLFTNLAGILLGRKGGTAAVGAYLLIGLVGVPVFTGGGGLSYVFQPTFGYLVGFLAGAWIAGAIVEKKGFSAKSLLLAGGANLAIVYILGLVYFYLIMLLYVKEPVSIGVLFMTGFVMAVSGDIVLCILSVILAKRLRPVVRMG